MKNPISTYDITTGNKGGINMLHFGQLHKYQPSEGPISTYLEWVTLFFQANNIPQEKRMAVFLSLVGTMMYTLLRALLALKEPKEKSLQIDLTNAYQEMVLEESS